MPTLHCFLLRTIIAVSLILNAATASAQPPRDKILDAVRIVQKPGCVVINIGLSFPFRYKSHFPFSFGEELRLKIEPISVSQVDRDALFSREGTSPKAPKGALQLGVELLEVVYEGDISGGPYITLFFRNPISFQVSQGSDFRSVLVASSGPEALPSCQPRLSQSP